MAVTGAPFGLSVALVMPARDEAEALPRVLAAVPRWLAQVIVVDNGSRDGTAGIARRHGATVIAEPRRGYGQACLAGLAALADGVEVVVFMDADASDSPADMDALLAPIASGEAELVIGSRTRGACERGALTPQQRLGNALACALMRLVWGARYSDLGPFRAIRRDALDRLAMADRTWGWTVEMQVKAAREGLAVVEVPVAYRRRVGRSKISGTVMGSLRAGAKILAVIGREAIRGWV
jgi:glycosyltransferase involved in cell wall biosynthesis